MFHPLPPGSTSRAYSGFGCGTYSDLTERPNLMIPHEVRADGTIQQLPPSEPLLLGRPPLPFKATTSTPTQGASSLYPHQSRSTARSIKVFHSPPFHPTCSAHVSALTYSYLTKSVVRCVYYLPFPKSFALSCLLAPFCLLPPFCPVTVLLSLSEVVCSVLPVVRCVYYLPVPKSFAPSCLLAPFRLLPPFSPSHRITFPFRSRLLHPACCPLCLLPSRSEVVCSVLPVGSVSSLTSVLAQSPCRLRRDSPRLVRSFLASPFAAAMSHPVSFGVAASHQSGPLQNDPAANDGQAYYGPRDTAHPGSNHHRSRVAGKTTPCASSNQVIWPRGPSLVSAGGTYTRTTAKKRPPRAKKAVAAQAVVSAPKSVLEPSAPPLPPPPAQPLASRLPPPPALTTLPTNQSEPPQKKRAIKRTEGPLRPPQHLPLGREPSPEVNYDDFQDRDKRTRSSPEVMARIQGQSFDQLRVTVAKDPQYERLTVADKLEAENIYRTYQIAVYHLAIKNKLHIKPLLEYLGNNTRIRGPTNYNMFCKYDPVAGPIHRNHSLHVNDRSRQTGALWDLLTLDQQAKWKDQDYLDSLPPLPTPPPTSDSEDDGDDDTTTAPRRNLPRDRFQFSTWLRNVRRDLKNMSSSHQMEGYLVLASRDARQPVLRTAGSIMADEFLSILAEDTDQTQSFFRFVTGKQAVKDVSGSWPVPARTLKRRGGIEGDNPDCAHCLGYKKANTTAIRTKLRTALRKATHGAWQSGWPGTNTATVLRSLGVTLSIQVNERLITAAEFCKRPSDMRIGQSRRVLTALANGWFKLTGPPAPDDIAVGADDLTDPGDDRSDDGESPDGGLSVASRPKKPLPRKKAVVVPKRATAHPKKTPTTSNKAAPRKKAVNKKGISVGRGRDQSVESSAISSSSDEAESLVARITLETSPESSSSEDSSLPSLSQLGNRPSRTNAPQTPSSDESPLPPVSLPNHSPSVISERSAPLPHQTSRSPSVISHRFTPLPHLSPSSDSDDSPPPPHQPWQLEGRARSWTPVPAPAPWGCWHYYWPHELDLDAIREGRPGPWDDDWVEPPHTLRDRMLGNYASDDESTEVPRQEDSSSEDNDSDSVASSSRQMSFDEFEYQRSQSSSEAGDYDADF
ncbi:hypothetical protein H4Q26_004866 [Puccinia striiformis f. sp. tritici PST-130]|nr:hypothetical protein H4Q26_004866 [Puccinia striiformis f. sp. tritici PST-130]